MLCKESHHFKSEKSLNKNSYLVKLHSFNWTGRIGLVCFRIPVLCSRNLFFFHKTWLNFVLSVFLYAFGGKEIILVLESNLVFVYMQEPEKSDFHLHRFNATLLGIHCVLVLITLLSRASEQMKFLVSNFVSCTALNRWIERKALLLSFSTVKWINKFAHCMPWKLLTVATCRLA